MSRQGSVVRTALALACVVLVWNEWLCFRAASWRWPDLAAVQQGGAPTMRLLVVSDPQLLGYLNEPPGAVGSLSRWDADNYLRRTYQLAYSYVQPDGVVFLGDLLDEGSVAAHAHYHQYHQRFKKIFDVPHKDVNMIYIPGDNDVGGEDVVKDEEKVMRFEAHFGYDAFYRVKFADFMHMDMDYSQTYEGEKREMVDELGKLLDQKIRISINHHPILPRKSTAILEALQRLGIQLSLTGHDHKAEMFTCDDCLTRDPSVPYTVESRPLSGLDHWIQFDVQSSAVTELMMPTCSYRMGEDHMGYGVLVIEPEGKTFFTILWSGSRYSQLYLYVAFSCLLSIYALVEAYRTLSGAKRKARFV